MRWVHCYGEAIVEHYLATISRLDFSTLNSLPPHLRIGIANDAFARVDRTAFLVQQRRRTQPLADALGIRTFNRGTAAASFEALRQAPTLEEPLVLLLGACIICNAILKPSRQSDLAYLDRHCLTRRHDGYYLRFDLDKINSGEANQSRCEFSLKTSFFALRI